MNLTYVMGPVVATDTLYNVNVQFHRVRDRQENETGWGWGIDYEDSNESEEPDALLELDESQAIEELLTTIREELYERVAEWREEHPLETKRDERRAKQLGITLP
jgi:hypothetical protein